MSLLLEVEIPRSYCFPPVVNANTRLLILGSLPSTVSLRAQQYYAHPHNQFWRLLSTVFTLPLLSCDYPDRLTLLRSIGIGLWDVIGSAKRVGSLDARIQAAAHNDLQSLLSTLPQLNAVAFNGQTAGRAARQLPKNLPYCILPSSSPALTWPFEQKLEQWREIAKWIHPAQ